MIDNVLLVLLSLLQHAVEVPQFHAIGYCDVFEHMGTFDAF